MRRLAYILPSLLLFFIPLFAQASLVATYQGFVSVGLGTYTSPLCHNLAIGSAYSNRRLLVAIIGGPSYWTPSDITINGSSAIGSSTYTGSGSPVGSFSGQLTWAWADVPTGTTADVDVITTTSNINGSGTWICMAYTFDKTLAASAPTTTKANIANPATSLSNSIATAANGFLIADIVTALHVSASGLGITSSDETFTNDQAGSEGSGKYLISSKTSGTASSAASHITWGWTGNSQALSSMLFWGPAASPAPAPARKLRLFEGFKIKLISGKLKLNQQ